MATKEQIIEELAALGVAAEPDAKKAELEKLLEETKAEKEDEVAEPVKQVIVSPKPSIAGKWIKVDKSEVMKLQAEKRLVGFNPKTMEALVK